MAKTQPNSKGKTFEVTFCKEFKTDYGKSKSQITDRIITALAAMMWNIVKYCIA